MELASRLHVAGAPDSVEYAWLGDATGAGVDVTAMLRRKFAEQHGGRIRISYKALGVDPAPKKKTKLIVRSRS